MSESENATKKVSFEVPNTTELAKKRPIIQVMFGLVFLLFFFNFFTIKCNDTKLIALSGINLVTGVSDVSKQLAGPLKELGSMNDSQDDENKANDKDNKIAPNFFAILAFGTVIIGGIILFVSNKSSNLIATTCSVIAFISLILLRLTFGGSLQDQGNDMIKVSIGINFAYWFALFLLLGTTYLSYIRYKNKY